MNALKNFVLDSTRTYLTNCIIDDLTNTIRTILPIILPTIVKIYKERFKLIDKEVSILTKINKFNRKKNKYYVNKQIRKLYRNGVYSTDNRLKWRINCIRKQLGMNII